MPWIFFENVFFLQKRKKILKNFKVFRIINDFI